MADLPTHEVNCINHGVVARVGNMAHALTEKAFHLNRNKQCFGKVAIVEIDRGKEGIPPPRKEGNGGESKEG